MPVPITVAAGLGVSRARNRKAGRRDARAAASSDAAGLNEGVWATTTGTVELERDSYVPGAWLLRVNGVPSSHIVPDRPDRLEFEYMRWFSTLAEDHVTRNLDPTALRILHLGGGACSMARYFAWRFPDARQVVVELDATLTRLVREWLDLPRAPLLRIRPGEAREVTEALTGSSRELVLRDVFAGEQTPGHVNNGSGFVGITAQNGRPFSLSIFAKKIIDGATSSPFSAAKKFNYHGGSAPEPHQAPVRWQQVAS